MKERVLRSDIESAWRLRSAGSNDDGDGGLHAYQLLAVFSIKNRLSGTVARSLSKLSKPYHHFHLNPNFSSIPLLGCLAFFLIFFTLIALCQNARALVVAVGLKKAQGPSPNRTIFRLLKNDKIIQSQFYSSATM